MSCPSSVVSDKAIFVHGLPNEPRADDQSIIISSHDPIIDGADIVTTGMGSKSSLRIKINEPRLVGHMLQLSPMSQKARSTLDINWIGLPGTSCVSYDKVTKTTEALTQ